MYVAIFFGHHSNENSTSNLEDSLVKNFCPNKSNNELMKYSCQTTTFNQNQNKIESH